MPVELAIQVPTATVQLYQLAKFPTVEVARLLTYAEHVTLVTLLHKGIVQLLLAIFQIVLVVHLPTYALHVTL